VTPSQSAHYDKQFAHLYYVRLMEMRKRVEEVATRRWSSAGAPLRKILHVVEGEECVVVGTLFKDLKLRPNLIEAYAKDRRAGPPPPGTPPPPTGTPPPAPARPTPAPGPRPPHARPRAPRPLPRRRLQEALEDCRFASPSDALVMEDEGARMALAEGAPGVLPRRALCTGVVCAVLGKDTGSGTFEVRDVCFAGLGPQRPLPALGGAPGGGAPRVALVSGLGLARGSNGHLVQQMADWLSGALGTEEDQRKAASVCRVIVAGGTVANAAGLAGPRGRRTDPGFARGAGGSVQAREGAELLRQLQARIPEGDGGAGDDADGPGPAGDAPAFPLEGCGDDAGAAMEDGADAEPEHARHQKVDPTPVLRADRLLTELAGHVPVDLMPGRGDPCTASLPQQPLHRCLLPGVAGFAAPGAATRATNPHELSLGGVRVLGTSGQNLHDLWRYTEIDSGLALAASTLVWGHLAPTAPDTLACFPFSGKDPFVLTEAPHLYFAGDQPAFETAVVEGAEGQRTRVVLVPRFDQTGQIVLVDLGTLEAEVVQFGTLFKGP